MQHSGITKRVYIFDDYVTSLRNGVGAYIRELSYCLKTIGCTVTLMAMNSEYEDFTVKKYNGMCKWYFPKFSDRLFTMEANAMVLSRFIRLYIEDSADNVFFFNHTPGDSLMKVVRRYYVHSKLVYVVHNLTWSSLLLGDVCRMEQIIEQRKRNEKDRQIFENWKMQLRTMEVADAVVCLSEDTLNALKRISAAVLSKAYLIPNGLRCGKSKCSVAEKMELRKAFGIQTDEIILLFVGRMTESKGVFALMKSLAILREKYKGIRLAIAGSLVANDLNDFAEVMSNVICLGYLNKEKLFQWYKMADIGMVASYTEQCSYVGLEMMLYGLPIVASDGFGVRCMFENGINAMTACIGEWTSDCEYVHNIVDAVIKLVENDEVKMQLVLNGQKVLRQKYSIRIMKENYRSLLTSL